MILTKRTLFQIAFFVVITVVSGTIMIFDYMGLPNLIFGSGHYTVTVQLPAAAGLYETANVTYRGTEVGRVRKVHLSDTGVDAVLSLRSGIDIPGDVDAQVHSQSAVGEQFVALIPRGPDGPPLRDGDVIPLSRSAVPPDIGEMLDAVNTGLTAIPDDDLRTVVDESYTAVGGLGPEIARLVKGSTTLALDARRNLDALMLLIDNAGPVLESQSDSADSLRAWAANLASITRQLKTEDSAVAGVLEKGPAAADAARQLFDRMDVTLPVVLANLVSVGQVAITYQPNIEQILVLAPPTVEVVQGSALTNRNATGPYRGAFLSFNLNINLPPACTTGFLPAAQVRVPSLTDYPERPAGDLYCRVPQDAMFNVRGARNLPCETRPGKRAPTVKMCESDENYVPLNDGYNWKGDPNATLTGQSVPQPPPGTPGSTATPPAAAAPDSPNVASAVYDPATGRYVGPDGNVYVQSDLAPGSTGGRTWQSMLLPPESR